MRWTAVVMGLALAACGPVELGEVPGSDARRDAVLGGRVALDEPSVFLLSIRYPGSAYICTATLVSPRLLLTAAHCLEGNPTSVRATNAISLYDARGADWIRAVKLHVHPDYKSGELAFDIGSVELEREPFAAVIPPNFDPLDNWVRGHPVRVVGYGLTSTDADDSGLKRSGNTQISKVDPETFDFGQWGIVMTGTCSGDSGGPTIDFINGERRVIGVHSYHSGQCGQNTDRRVDAYAPLVQRWIAAADGASCQADGRCASGCANPDLDCGCVDDGQCNPACAAPSLDPDCDTTCIADGLCSSAACATPDPDCAPLGATCGRPGHCGGRLCITSEQHPVPYCSQPCAGPSDCPSSLVCVAGQCEYPVLPVLTEGEACTIGQTYCGGVDTACATWEREATPRCSRICYDESDCTRLEACVDSPEAYGICVPNIVVTRLRTETLPASGCTSVPVLHAISLLALLGSLRRKTHLMKTRS